MESLTGNLHESQFVARVGEDLGDVSLPRSLLWKIFCKWREFADFYIGCVKLQQPTERGPEGSKLKIHPATVVTILI